MAKEPRVPQTITLRLSVREGVRLRAQEKEIPISRYVEELIIKDLGLENANR